MATRIHHITTLLPVPALLLGAFVGCGGTSPSPARSQAPGGDGGDGDGGAMQAAGKPSTTTGGKPTAGAGGSSASSAGAGGNAVAGASVTVSPGVAQVVVGGEVQFTAIVAGADDRSVQWKVQEGDAGGAIDETGRYTAPASSGKYHVVATSTGNGSLTDTAEVNVTLPMGTPPDLVPGVWKDITPPVEGFKKTFGVTTLEVSPVDPRTIYIPISSMGFWRTTDGGSNWKQLGDKSKAPAANGNTVYYLDSPVRIEVDPGDPNHLYATEGAGGERQGFWVSHDAGESWEMTPGFQEILKKTTRDLTHMDVDPHDFKHVLVASHSGWEGGNAGILETKDGGESWTAHPPEPSWPVGSIGVNFLYDPINGHGSPDTWLVTTDSKGFWLTKDGAKTWKQVSTVNAPHGGAQTYMTSAGHIYSGGREYPTRSLDGGETWQHLRDAGLPFYYYYTIWGDGKTLYTMGSYASTGEREDSWWTSLESDGTKFVKQDGGKQVFTNGPNIMRYDATNGIMYGACWTAGLFALKVIK